jgi:hypothetical protein
MNPRWRFYLQFGAMFFLFFAAFHAAGYVFGWTKFRQEDWGPLIVGGISGGAAAAFVSYRNRQKQNAKQPLT